MAIHPTQIPVLTYTPATAPTAIIYTIGEVLISLAVITGAFALMFYAPNPQATTAGGVALGAVTTFWFSRRQAEQSNNNLAMLANGKLTQLLEQQGQITSQQNNILTLTASQVRATNDATRMASEAAQASAQSVQNLTEKGE